MVAKPDITKLSNAFKGMMKKGVPLLSNLKDFNPLKNKFIIIAFVIFIGICSGFVALFNLGNQAAVEHYNFAAPTAETFISIADEYESTLKPNKVDVQTNGSIFKNKFNKRDKKPKIAIIVTDLGISETTTENAILDLPYQVALAYSPYSKKLSFWMEQSHIEQHETLLSLPMEPKQYPLHDPGPKALLTRSSAEENKGALKRLISRRYGSVGYINYMGNRFLSDRKKLLPVFREIAKTDAFFVSHKPGIKSRASETAIQAGLKFKRADIVLDEVASQNHITNQLLQLEKLATNRGYAVGIAGNYPVTFKTITKWSKTLKRKGITLAPISAVMDIANDADS